MTTRSKARGLKEAMICVALFLATLGVAGPPLFIASGAAAASDAPVGGTPSIKGICPIGAPTCDPE